jgi:4-hydroxy-3-polyprenylbenzoate decarboxylase
MRTVVALTGASGAAYGVEFLKRCPGEKYVILSRWGREALRLELGLTPEDLAPHVTRFFDDDDLAAALSSGSNPWDAYVVVPCSVTTLARIACGLGDTLITRTAQVAMKERRRLVLAVRETPLTTIALQHMLTLSREGVVIAPAAPPFYQGVRTVDDLVGGYVNKLLRLIGAEPGGGWRAEEMTETAE